MTTQPTEPSLDSKKWWACVLAVCLLHAGILLYNLSNVPPTHGYDWPGHLSYLQYAADHWRTPPPEASAEFFNLPLYYFSAAALHHVTGLELGKSAQTLNVLLALLALGWLVALCRRLWGRQILPAVWLLGFYVLNPTIYRTFGMARPEAMIIPIFLAAGWLVTLTPATPKQWQQLAVWTGCLAGLAFGVRQWAVFLQAACMIWLFFSYRRTLNQSITSRGLWACLGLQTIPFLLMAILFLRIRGGGLLSFNAYPHWPDLRLLTRLDLPTLFSWPVRPALDDSFWPVLYADLWGDYWRYWREALGRDPMPSSPAMAASLARSMWAALPVMGLTLAGLLSRNSFQDQTARARAALHTFVRGLIAVSLTGYTTFAILYSEFGKGDTVKSIYLVYLIPFGGWLCSVAVHGLAKRLGQRAWVLWLPLALLIFFVLPNCFFLPTTNMIDRTWQKPPIQCPLDVTFGDKIDLVGYTLQSGPAEGDLSITLVWKTDVYVGANLKVFVHLVDKDGRLLAQSDAIPANWLRTTPSWLPGEFISDPHTLAFQPPAAPAPLRVFIGLYDDNNTRLFTASGDDHATISFTLGQPACK